MRDKNEAIFTKMFRLTKMIPTSETLMALEIFKAISSVHIWYPCSRSEAIGVALLSTHFTSSLLEWICVNGIKKSLQPSPHGSARRCKVHQDPVLSPGMTSEMREKDKAQSELNEVEWVS